MNDPVYWLLLGLQMCGFALGICVIAAIGCFVAMKLIQLIFGQLLVEDTDEGAPEGDTRHFNKDVA